MKCRYSFAQKVQIRRQLARPAQLAQTIDRRLNPTPDVFSDRFRVTHRPPRKRGNLPPLVGAVSSSSLQVGPSALPPRSGRMAPMVALTILPRLASAEWSAKMATTEFSTPTFRKNCKTNDTAVMRGAPDRALPRAPDRKPRRQSMRPHDVALPTSSHRCDPS